VGRCERPFPARSRPFPYAPQWGDRGSPAIWRVYRGDSSAEPGLTSGEQRDHEEEVAGEKKVDPLPAANPVLQGGFPVWCTLYPSSALSPERLHERVGPVMNCVPLHHSTHSPHVFLGIPGCEGQRAMHGLGQPIDIVRIHQLGIV
jgi:hypothetical protein